MAVSTFISALITICYNIININVFLIPLSIFSGFLVPLGFFSPVTNTIFMNSLPESIRGIAQGFTGTLWRFGMGMGGYAMGNIWKLYGITTIAYFASLLLMGEIGIILKIIPKE
jgi:hypothetical protein